MCMCVCNVCMCVQARIDVCVCRSLSVGAFVFACTDESQRVTVRICERAWTVVCERVRLCAYGDSCFFKMCVCVLSN